MWRVVAVSACLLIASCGSSHHQADAAPGGDGSPTDAPADVLLVDATPDAPPPGPVTITVYDWSQAPAPAPGMPVMFLDAAGNVVSSTTTDAQGTASAVMDAGGSVTTRRPARTGFAGDWVYMFIGVKPSDHLYAGEPAPTTPAMFSATVQVPPFTGAADYEITTQCGGGLTQPSGTTSNLFFSCSPVDLYVRARDSSINHNTLAGFYKQNVAVSQGATIDLTGETYRPLRDYPVTITNIPNNVNSVDVVLDLKGSFYFNDQRVLGGFISNNTFTITTQYPDIPNIDITTLVRVADNPQSGQPTAQEFKQLVPYGANYTLDAGSMVIPWVTSVAGFDLASHSMYWFESPGQQPADYVRGDFNVTHAQNDPRPRFRLDIAGPYSPGALVLPVLPDAFAIYNMTATDIYSSDVYAAKSPGGWDAARPHILNWTLFPNPDLSQTFIVSEGVLLPHP